MTGVRRDGVQLALVGGGDRVHVVDVEHLPHLLADHGGAVDEGVGVAAQIEASGPAAGLASALARVRRGGRVVGLGLLPLGDSPVPGNLLRRIRRRG